MQISKVNNLNFKSGVLRTRVGDINPQNIAYWEQGTTPNFTYVYLNTMDINKYSGNLKPVSFSVLCSKEVFTDCFIKAQNTNEIVEV